VFCIPNSNEGYFRVNLQGREPQGIVSPGAEYDDLIGRLQIELKSLVNPQNGVRAADRVAAVDEVFPGPRRKDLPDAVINWNAAAGVISQLEGPASGRVDKGPGYAISPFYTGNHRPTAFVIGRGAGVAPASSLTSGHILDIAPTILTALGVEVPRHFEGRAWQ
jgi:predicted AlkP superfamily phosphohydrolase/phosphomutase